VETAEYSDRSTQVHVDAPCAFMAPEIDITVSRASLASSRHAARFLTEAGLKEGDAIAVWMAPGATRFRLAWPSAARTRHSGSDLWHPKSGHSRHPSRSPVDKFGPCTAFQERCAVWSIVAKFVGRSVRKALSVQRASCSRSLLVSGECCFVADMRGLLAIRKCRRSKSCARCTPRAKASALTSRGVVGAARVPAQSAARGAARAICCNHFGPHWSHL